MQIAPDASPPPDDAARIAATEAAAAAGDQEAMFLVAHWRFYGIDGEPDYAAAHDLLARAASAGHRAALHVRASLIASGGGVAADPVAARTLLAGIAGEDRLAAVQVALLDAMPPEDAIAPGVGLPLSTDPAVVRMPGFFSGHECRYLITRAAHRIRPSMIIDPETLGPTPHPNRTSGGMNFGPLEEDPVIHALNRRIARACGRDVRCGEPLQILRYDPGQEYRPHLDALSGSDNPRVATMLVVLDDRFEGGETDFPRLGVRFRGAVGDALLFANTRGDRVPDPRTLHAGRPVTAGTKWIASRWIRERPVTAWNDPAAKGEPR